MENVIFSSHFFFFCHYIADVCRARDTRFFGMHFSRIL